MSKRAEEAAMKMFPEKLTAGAGGYGYGMYSFTYDMNQQVRYGAVKGYEQAEKETLERVIEWWRPRLCGFLKEGLTEGVLGEFRKAMEEEL